MNKFITYVLRTLFICTVSFISIASATNIMLVGTGTGCNSAGCPASTGQNLIANGDMTIVQNINTSINNAMVAGDNLSYYPYALNDGIAPSSSFYSTGTNGLPIDVLVVVSVYNDIDASDWTAIKQAAVNNPNLSIVLFRDACASCSSHSYLVNTGNITTSGINVTQNVIDLVHLINPSSQMTVGSEIMGTLVAPLNNSSAFITGANFTSPTFTGFDFYQIDNVANDNIVYYSSAPAPATFNSAYTIMLPFSQSSGACLFATIDASGFNGAAYAANPNIMADFLRASTAPSSGCLAVSPFAIAKKVSNDNGSFVAAAGDTLTYTLIVTNSSATARNGAIISDNIPAGTTYVAGSITSDNAILTGNDTNPAVMTWGAGDVSASTTINLSFKVKVNANVAQSQIVNMASDNFNDTSTDATGQPGSTNPKGETVMPTLFVAKPIPADSLYALLLLMASLCFVAIYLKNSRKSY